MPGSAVVRVAGLWLVALCVLALVAVAARASSSVYVLNFISDGAGGVSQYDLGAGGGLSPLATATVAAGNEPYAIAVSPDGKSVYVANDGANGAGGVSQYDVGPGGALSPKATPAVAAGNGPAAIAVSPDGKDVYVANNNTGGAGGVSEYDVGPGGVLAPMATPTVAAGSAPLGIAVSPDGKSVYVANNGAPAGPNGIFQYDVGANGALSAMATPTVAAGNSPTGIVVSPDGKSVYVANDGANGAGGLSQYDVGPGGALSPMATPTVAAGNGPLGIAISPDGKNVYVANDGANGAGGVSQYAVGPGGALSPMATPTVAAGNGPLGIAISPDGKSVYVTNGNVNGAGGVSQYDVGPGGALSPKATPTVAAGNEPAGIAVLPDQGPVAAFSATAAPPGSPTSFDGSASRASDGAIASYAWSFGDGTSLTTSSPLVTHVYARTGGYTATLTVTDDAGCSTVLVFTGQTALCNGGPQAQTTRQLTIAAAPSVQISSPKSGARYTRGQLVRASYACREGSSGPGISTCAGAVPDGQPIDTSTAGQHSVTVTATSKDGQSSTATVSYTVLSDNHFTVSHIKTHRDGIMTFTVKVPGPGRIDVLETAWDDNIARTAIQLQPAAHRFVFARAHRTARRATTLQLRVSPNARGKLLVHHHTYRVVLRLWVSYAPVGGAHRRVGFYGLHLPK